MQLVQNRERLDQEIKSSLAGLSAEEVRQRMRTAQVAFAQVNGVAELTTHPHLRRISVPTATGEVAVVAPPAMVRGDARQYRAIPALGEHTEQIRAEFGTGPADRQEERPVGKECVRPCRF